MKTTPLPRYQQASDSSASTHWAGPVVKIWPNTYLERAYRAHSEKS